MPTSPWRFVGELFEDRSGTPYNADGTREYMRYFRVETTDKTLGPIAATVCPGVPLYYSFYITQNGSEFDTLALLINKSATQMPNNGDWCVWKVSCKYSTQMPPGGQPPDPGNPGDVTGGSTTGGGALNNPEQEMPDVEWDHEVFQHAPRADRNGDAFVNSALQPFSPPPTFPVAVPTLSITRNELGYNRVKAQQYSYSLNDAPFLGAPAGAVQCLPPKAKMQFRGGLQYWRISYKLRFIVEEINAGSFDWQPRILDAGMMQFAKPIKGLIAPDLANMTLIPIWRGSHQVTSPVLLDGFGRAQDPKLVPDPLDPVNNPPKPNVKPVYITRELYRYKDFSSLLSQGLGAP